MMRVLHVINDLEPAGAQRLLVELLKVASTNGEIQMDVLSIRDSKKYAFYREIELLSSNLTEGNFASRFNPLILNFLWRKSRKYDVVHTHLFPEQYWLPLIKGAVGLRAKLVTTEHNTYNRRRDMHWLRPIERLIYNSYDRIISISQETEDELKKWLGEEIFDRNRSRYTVIENGVDLDTFRDERRTPRDLPPKVDGKVYLLMVGRLEDQKDHLTVFKALQHLPPNYELLLVGEGSREQEYRNFCRDNELSERVSFLGARDDVPAIMKFADVGILSSNWEGFGLVAVEYMAAGKPVIASDVPGLNKVVGGAGLLFEKADHEELKARILEVTGDFTRYAQVTNACRERAKNFSIERMYNSYLSLYKELMHGGGGSTDAHNLAH